ncbi:hypothetical protein DXG01_009292, partial [Tephrocybe rancida]
TMLEAERFLNEQHEQQERECDKLRVQALLAQQMSVSPPFPPVATLMICDGPHTSPAVVISSGSSSPSRSNSASRPSEGPISDSPSDMVTEQDELETKNGGGSGLSVGEGGQGAGSEGDVWEGIPAIVPGSKLLAHSAHLNFVLDKLFIEVMRVLHLQDPTLEWCAAA